MTSHLCGRCLNIRVPACPVWLPSVLSAQVRSMKSVNTRSPRPVHITRAKLMRVTEYQKPKETRPLAEQCSMRYKEKTKHPEKQVQTFLANQCRRQLMSCSLIAVFHNEGLSREEMAIMKRRLLKAGIAVKVYGNKVIREALLDTRLANMEPLFVGQNVYAVSGEPAVAALLKATKKLPKIHLLGGLVENRFMSARQMTEFSQLPAKNVLQGQLAGLLSQSVGSTYGLLQQNQQALVTNLSQWNKQREEETSV